MMLKRVLTLLAAVFALGLAFGSSSDASAHGGAPGCCGPLRPSYTHRNVYPRAHVVERRVTKVHTTRFPQYHPIIHVTHVHPTTIIHTTLVDIHRRVGYKVDVHRHVTEYAPTRVLHTMSVVHKSICICVKGGSRCR